MKMLLFLIMAVALVLIIIAKVHPAGKKISLYIVLGLIALIMLLPFFMMFVMATHTTSEIFSFPPAMWFGGSLSENLANMNLLVDFPKSFLNSCIVTGLNTILVLLFCSVGGYAFAVYDFPGRKALFAVFTCNYDGSLDSGNHSLVSHDVKTGMAEHISGIDHPQLCQRLRHFLDASVLSEQCTCIPDRSRKNRRLQRVDYIFPCGSPHPEAGIRVSGNHAVCQCME